MRRALTVVASCLAFASCGDSTAPPVATTLEIVSAQTQSGTAGRPVPQAPSFLVKDQSGNPMAGVPVIVSVVEGGGVVANAATVSAAGPTSIGAWTLGPQVGNNRVTVTAASLPSVSFTAQGEVGPLAKLTPLSDLSLRGRTGSIVTPGPRVRATDEFDNPIAGATITVQVSAGSSVSSSELVTDANGTAMVLAWQLGETVGDYTLTLASGAVTTQFTATVTSGPPASAAVVAGGTQSAPAATQLTAPLRVRIRDAEDRNVEVEPVQFSVVAGGGSLASSNATTDFNGVVDVPAWTMGRTDVPQTIRVTAGSATLDITLQIATQFKIDFVFPGGMSEGRQAVFRRAAQRIQGIIVNDLPDIPPATADMSPCLFPGEMFSGPIDDVVIYAAVVPIDGVGNILGQAGPCYPRLGNPRFPAIGVMVFDAADVANLESLGRLEDVILHEMLHVMGIGTYWGDRGFIEAPSSLDVRYLGAGGRNGCLEAGGTSTCATSVPLHSCTVAVPPATGLTCAQGTVNSHWRESTFGNELMTGFINAGSNPLSAMTIGSLADLGYQVNPAPKDGYGIPGGSVLGNLIPGTSSVSKWEEVIRPVGMIDKDGRVIPLPAPQ